MNFVIASDIHGSSYYLKKLLDQYKKENASKLVLLGDILYHGPRNDLPFEYKPKEVIELLNNMKDDIICVRGNCDAEVDQMVLNFPIMADYLMMQLGKKTIYLTHGHKYNKDNPPPMSKGDILLCGHTHVVACEELDLFTYCNPGSISIPKNNTKNSYILCDGSSFVWKTLDGEEYMTLDF